MNATRRFFYGPSPEEQRQKCKALVQSNSRQLDREIANLKLQEKKARGEIVQANKRAQRNPSQAKQANSEIRTFARELIRIRRHEQRVVTSKATLESVGLQSKEAFAMQKIAGSLKNSVGIMKDVNVLVKLPEISGAMRELSQELVRAGIVEEMVSDALPDGEMGEGEEEEVESEVDKILGEILRDKVQTPNTQVPTGALEPEKPQRDEEEEIDSEEMLAQMRGRLQALKS